MANRTFPHVRAVFFDLDETLHDCHAGLWPFVERQFRALAMPEEQSRWGEYRDRFRALYNEGHSNKDVLYANLARQFHWQVTAAELADQYRREAFRPAHGVAGSREALEELRARGLRTGIITNGLRVVQGRKIADLKLEPLLDAILISDSEGVAKPDVRIFQRAAARLHLRPEECAFVGDHPEKDVLGAREAGFTAIWLRRGTPWPEAPGPEPHATISHLSELPSVLGAAADRKCGWRTVGGKPTLEQR